MSGVKCDEGFLSYDNGRGQELNYNSRVNLICK